MSATFAAGRHYFLTLMVTVPQVTMGAADPGQPIADFYTDLGFSRVSTVPMAEAQPVTVNGSVQSVPALQWACLVEFDSKTNQSFTSIDEPSGRWRVLAVEDSGPAYSTLQAMTPLGGGGDDFKILNPDFDGLSWGSAYGLTRSLAVASLWIALGTWALRASLGRHAAAG